ncbi:flavin reductase family protein [uncultured Litoreibacter sp.]|uniref:flavin reductase family protein n=1 Tax=uncultured Litoreibacter sp. TaxID=1392394 RepID=UPI00261E4E73|nr:flavin reductase family protein [uncultured Litoreibacter sp.]
MPDATLKSDFIDAMSSLVSTVTIVTTDGLAGQAGATVSAMSSVSADGDAPTMLVCLHHEASATAAILKNGCFCVNALQQGQQDIANVFASRSPVEGGSKFNVASFAPLVTGAPVLDSALATFDCKLQSHERIGTHHVMIGAVHAVKHADGKPLLYGNRAYRSLTPPAG